MSKLMLGTRAFASFLRALEFCIAALILGIFSYYLAVLSRRGGNTVIPRWEKAVEGMSGAAVIYTAFAVILTCFLGGIAGFSLLGIILDILFCGAFVAIAILARGGKNACGGINNSPIGPGNHTSCQLLRATFIVAIIAAFLFLISAILEFLLMRTHKREKRYGPSPSNNYTSGSGKKRFWQRKSNKTKHNKGMEEAELGAVGAGALAVEDHHHHNNHHNNRNSNITGDTAVGDGYGGPNTKYATAAEPTQPSHNTGYAQSDNRYTQQSSGYTSTTNYEPQSTGVASNMPEMEGTANRPYVQHDPEPYAEVHHGGFVHSNPESKMYTR